MIRKSKKSQFYILTAFVILALSFVIFTLSKNTSVFKKDDDSFNKLKNNYIRESSEVINNIIYEKSKFDLENPEMNKFDLFTNDFLDFSKSKDTSFSLAYIFSYHDSLLIGNYLEDSIIFSINSSNYTIENKKTIKINSSVSDFSIYAYENSYQFAKEKDIDLNVLFRSEKDSEVRIFAYE